MATNPYTELEKRMQAQLEEQKKAQLSELEQEANKQSQQAYVRLLQQQNNAPVQAAVTGRTGGAAQTLMAQPQMAYNNALSQINQQKVGEMGKINTQYNSQAVQNAISFADKIMGYDSHQQQIAYNQAQDQKQFDYNLAKYAASLGDYTKLQSYGINTAPAQNNAGMKRRETGYTYLLVDKDGGSQNEQRIFNGTSQMLIGNEWLDYNAFQDLLSKGVIQELQNPDGSKYWVRVR